LRVRADPIPIILAMLEATNISRGIMLKQLHTDEFYIISHSRSWDSWLGYELDEQGTKVWFLAGVREFYLLRSTQTGSLVHPASYPVGKSGRGMKLTTVFHLLLSKNGETIPPLFQMSSRHGA
jgi:hypothetical protein